MPVGVSLGRRLRRWTRAACSKYMHNGEYHMYPPDEDRQTLQSWPSWRAAAGAVPGVREPGQRAARLVPARSAEIEKRRGTDSDRGSRTDFGHSRALRRRQHVVQAALFAGGARGAGHCDRRSRQLRSRIPVRGAKMRCATARSRRIPRSNRWRPAASEVTPEYLINAPKYCESRSRRARRPGERTASGHKGQRNAVRA